MSQRGSGLLDAVAATAVALTIGAASTDLVDTVRTLSTASQRETLLTTARNVLDGIVGAPCAAPPACPPGLTCSVRFEPLATTVAGAARVDVTVSAENDPESSGIRMRTAVIAVCS